MKIKKMSFNTIRTKLTLSFISICIIPLMILGTISCFQSKSMLSKKFQVSTKESLSELNFALDNYFSGKSNMTNLMAINYDFINIDQNNNIDYAGELLKSVKESDKDILSTYVGTESKNCLPI